MSRACGRRVLAAHHSPGYSAPVPWSSPDTRRNIREGLAASLALAPGILPFGALFGAVAVGSDLTRADAIIMSAAVYAGASQLVAIDLWGQSVPLWWVVVSVLAVNFRFVLYSAALTPIFHRLGTLTRFAFLPLLVDPLFADTQKRLEEGKGFSPAAYAAMGLALYTMWVGSSVAGAFFGALVEDPRALALDMIMPLFFLTLVMGFRGRPHWGATVGVAGIVSILVHSAPSIGLTMLGAPWHIMAGAAAGIAAAVALSSGDEKPVSLGPAAEDDPLEPAPPDKS